MKRKTSKSYLALVTLAAAAILALPNLAVAGKKAPLTLNDTTVSYPAGNYDAFVLTTVDPDLKAGNIKSGVTLFGVTGKCYKLPATGQSTSYSAGDDGTYQLVLLRHIA